MGLRRQEFHEYLQSPDVNSLFAVELPPLRDRVDDIAPLAAHFLKEICCDFGRDILMLSRQQMATLEKHSWPGNVRELKNVLERSVILTTGNRLRLDLAMSNAVAVDPVIATAKTSVTDYLTEVEFREKERQNLEAVLRSASGRVWGPDGAAAMLGIKPSTLAYRMKAFGLSS